MLFFIRVAALGLLSKHGLASRLLIVNEINTDITTFADITDHRQWIELRGQPKLSCSRSRSRGVVPIFEHPELYLYLQVISFIILFACADGRTPEAVAELPRIAINDGGNPFAQLDDEARALARASQFRKRRSPCDEDQHHIFTTVLVIFHGEDLASHTVVDLSVVPSVTEFFLISNDPTSIITLASSSTVFGIAWNSKWVRSRSRGWDNGGYLGIAFGHYSAAAVYHGPHAVFDDIVVDFTCNSDEFLRLLPYLIDVAFYTLGKKPNEQVINKCFPSRSFLKSTIITQRYKVRDTTFSLCPPTSDAILGFQTNFWQDAAPTPLQPNSCHPGMSNVLNYNNQCFRNH